MKDVIKTIQRYESRSMHNQLPVVWIRAEDFYIYDENGKRYIDFTSGVCVTNVGHSNKKICDAIAMQLDSGLLYSYNFYNRERAEFLEYLIKHTPKFIEKAFLVSSGTEACECAIKLMRLDGKEKSITKENKYIISFMGSMHGRTLGAEFLKGEAKWIGSWFPGVINVPFPTEKDKWNEWVNYLDINPSKICGIMLETYQGWSARFYPKKYIQDLVKWAKKHKILVCIDEIQGGMGRTGKLFNYIHYDIEPDLVCVGKGFTSGVPMSGVLGRKEILDLPKEGSMSSTYSANPLCCTVGLANFKEILRLLPTVEKKGKILHRELRKIFPKFEINGKGLLAGIITPSTEYATKVCYKAMKKGLLLIKTDKNSIKISPPLSVTIDGLRKGLNILSKII